MAFKNIRVGGAVAGASSAAIGFLYMKHLVSQAKQGVEYLHYSDKVIILCLAFTLIGLFCVVLGEKALGILNLERDSMTVLNVVLLLVLVVLGFVGYSYEMGILAGYGYS